MKSQDKVGSKGTPRPEKRGREGEREGGERKGSTGGFYTSRDLSCIIRSQAESEWHRKALN